MGLLKQQNLPHHASCPHNMVSVRKAPQEPTHPSSPLHCHGQGPCPSPLVVGSSYHEQLVHLALAFNVGLVVGKHLKPETQSRVRLGFACCRTGQQRHLPADRQGLAPAQGDPGQPGRRPGQAESSPLKRMLARTHLSWYMSMFTTSLKQLGSRGEKKPLLIWSIACRSSGRRS